MIETVFLQQRGLPPVVSVASHIRKLMRVMIERPNFRWDLLYGVALAVILTIAAAAAWMQSEPWSGEQKSPAGQVSPPAGTNCADGKGPAAKCD